MTTRRPTAIHALSRFTKHDRLMVEYRQAGIKRFIGLIGSQNEAYHCVCRQKDRDLREGALAAFAKFAGAVAERYRDYDILWEIINEPNENNATPCSAHPAPVGLHGS